MTEAAPNIEEIIAKLLEGARLSHFIVEILANQMKIKIQKLPIQKN